MKLIPSLRLKEGQQKQFYKEICPKTQGFGEELNLNAEGDSGYVLGIYMNSQELFSEPRMGVAPTAKQSMMLFNGRKLNSIQRMYELYPTKSMTARKMKQEAKKHDKMMLASVTGSSIVQRIRKGLRKEDTRKNGRKQTYVNPMGSLYKKAKEKAKIKGLRKNGRRLDYLRALYSMFVPKKNIADQNKLKVEKKNIVSPNINMNRQMHNFITLICRL